MIGDRNDEANRVKQCGRNALCSRNSKNRAPWVENGVGVLTEQNVKLDFGNSMDRKQAGGDGLEG